MPVKLGKPILWSKMEGDVLLEIATPTPEDVERARLAVVPPLRFFLDAPLAEKEDIIGTPEISPNA